MVFTDQEGNDATCLDHLCCSKRKNKAFTIVLRNLQGRDLIFLKKRKNREDKTWCYKTCISLGHPLQLKPHSEDPLFHDFRGHQSNKFQTL